MDKDGDGDTSQRHTLPRFLALVLRVPLDSDPHILRTFGLSLSLAVNFLAVRYRY